MHRLPRATCTGVINPEKGALEQISNEEVQSAHWVSNTEANGNSNHSNQDSGNGNTRIGKCNTKNTLSTLDTHGRMSPYDDYNSRAHTDSYNCIRECHEKLIAEIYCPFDTHTWNFDVMIVMLLRLQLCWRLSGNAASRCKYDCMKQ